MADAVFAADDARSPGINLDSPDLLNRQTDVVFRLTERNSTMDELVVRVFLSGAPPEVLQRVVGGVAVEVAAFHAIGAIKAEGEQDGVMNTELAPTDEDVSVTIWGDERFEHHPRRPADLSLSICRRDEPGNGAPLTSI